MPSKFTPRQKRAILRAVYEDNLGIRRPLAGRLRPAGAKEATVWSWAALVVLLPLATLGVYKLSPAKLSAPLSTQQVQAAQALVLQPADSLQLTHSSRTAERAAILRENPGPVAGMQLRRQSPADYLSLLSAEQVSIADLFGLGVCTIVIDPGHGGKDPGAIGPAGLMEKDVTLDVARRLQARLARHENYRILLTRDDDEAVSLKDRVEFANLNGADLFISLHVNYLPVEKHTVIETYYFGPQTDETALRLAERENQDSEYSMSDFRTTIQKIGNTFKYQESRHLATLIQSSLYGNISRENISILSSGIKTAPFMVLLGVDMPSVLTEISTLSNKREERQLSTETYRENIAHYLEQGIVEYLSNTSHDEGTILGAKKNGLEKTAQGGNAAEEG